jgi:hypothetical protein
MAAGLVDDTGRRHTVPDEYLGAAVDHPDTHCRQDWCLPTTVAAVAWGSPYPWVSGLWVCLGRRQCGICGPDQLIRTLSLR